LSPLESPVTALQIVAAALERRRARPLGGSVRVNSTPRRAQTPTWRFVLTPSGATLIQPVIDRPPTSVGFV